MNSTANVGRLEVSCEQVYFCSTLKIIFWIRIWKNISLSLSLSISWMVFAFLNQPSSTLSLTESSQPNSSLPFDSSWWVAWLRSLSYSTLTLSLSMVLWRSVHHQGSVWPCAGFPFVFLILHYLQYLIHPHFHPDLIQFDSGLNHNHTHQLPSWFTYSIVST